VRSETTGDESGDELPDELPDDDVMGRPPRR
jgi:hypothetical protein